MDRIDENLQGIALGHENIGDVLIMEPAMAALARKLQRRLPVFVVGPAAEILEGHPDLEVVGYETGLEEWLPRESNYCQPGWFRLNPTDAFQIAHDRGWHFGSAYFTLLDLGYTEQNAKPTLYHPTLAFPNSPENFICIAPYSRGCFSYKKPFATPNKMAPLPWWQGIIQASPYPVLCLSQSDEDPLPNTIPVQGKPLGEVAWLCRSAQLVITVETSILVISDAVDAKILSLNSATPQGFVDPYTPTHLTYTASSPLHWQQKEVVYCMKKLLNP